MTPKKNTPTEQVEKQIQNRLEAAKDHANDPLKYQTPWTERYIQDVEYLQSKVIQCVNEREALKASHAALLEAAKMLESLMTKHTGEFKIESKDLPTTILAGIMIDKFREAIQNAKELEERKDGE